MAKTQPTPDQIQTTLGCTVRANADTALSASTVTAIAHQLDHPDDSPGLWNDGNWERIATNRYDVAREGYYWIEGTLLIDQLGLDKTWYFYVYKNASIWARIKKISTTANYERPASIGVLMYAKPGNYITLRGYHNDTGTEYSVNGDYSHFSVTMVGRGGGYDDDIESWASDDKTMLRNDDMGDAIGCRVALSANQAITTATWTKIVYDVDDDTTPGGFECFNDGNYNTTTGVYTVPKDGKYFIHHTGWIYNPAAGNTNYCDVQINAARESLTKYNPTVTNYEDQMYAGGVFSLEKDDEITGNVYHNYGSNRDWYYGDESQFIVAYMGA